MRRYQTTLFIFRRDLRIYDNLGLNQALQDSEKVLPCFIFDPKQIQPHPYQSTAALGFMLQSIVDLQQQLAGVGASLNLYYDDPEQVIIRLHAQVHIQAVYFNRDYTPFSRARDYKLFGLCNNLGIDLHYVADALLTEPEQVQTQQQAPYKVFTSFYNKASLVPVPLPVPLSGQRFLSVGSEFSIGQLGLPTIHAQHFPGGRSAALAILSDLGLQGNYQETRDYPALNATSRLSAHLKFGTCSVREVFYAVTTQLGCGHPLLRQLYWRDFFTHIAYHFPSVFGRPFLEKYTDLPWDNNIDYFSAWCAGKTGFPIVDAGMRELEATGFMHNRVRMITASFLVKDLHIDWRWGERYFAQKLVDYDPCVNNGNWQWSASTGCDAQPYFRIFNPWLQQKKFDPDCKYIYRWLPELRNIPSKTIQKWDKKHHPGDYPAPIVDHAEQSKISKARYKNSG